MRISCKAAAKRMRRKQPKMRSASIERIGKCEGMASGCEQRGAPRLCLPVDAEVGVDQIRYTINDGKEQLYIAPLKGFLKDKEYNIKISAMDLLGNTSQKVVSFKTDKY